MGRKPKGLKIDRNTHKWCARCETVLTLDKFHKRTSACKPCESKRRKKPLNELRAKGVRLSNETHKWCPTCECLLDRSMFYKNRTASDGLRSECKACHNNREKSKRATDPTYRIRANVARAIRYGLGTSNKNNTPTFAHLPYTPEQLKEHLQAQFDEHMTWDNYGEYWHIDHVYPHSKLPYDSLEHPNFQKCWALDNLQPLEKIENIKKSNKILDKSK